MTLMTVEEKPDVTYNDVGGCKEQIQMMREVRIALIFFMLIFILYISFFGVHYMQHNE